MDLQLTDRTFVVTAASGGLGRATAVALLDEGARVVVVARRAEVLSELVGEYGDDRVVPLAADLADPEAGERAARLAVHRFGRLDGALVSVGGPPAGPISGDGANTDAQWQAAFESVFLAHLRVTRALIAHSTTETLAVAWVLSSSVKTPIGGLAVSNGFRPGLAMLIKQLADEQGPNGTRVIGLLPGRIETERVVHLDALAGDPAAARAASEAAIPLRRYGSPDEFGRVAAFVLSPAASYLSGCVVPVDGGALRAL